MILTDYFIKRKVRRLARETGNRNHCFRSLKEAHDILVFYEGKNLEEIEPCLETLRMLRKNVRACVYVAVEAPADFPESYVLLNKVKDLTVFGFPKEEVIKKVNAVKADILIDLTGKGCAPMRYLMLQHPSAFKIGLKRGYEQDMYDFSLSVTDRNDMKYLFGQIIFYLQTIRGK
ncbi:hypothetical protein [Parabacteroides sp. PF5-6]|uniref:DUF6913 domain-containing protein n=1 Tax=Parabacteroides sp. PF5-6 TaxID=1742403 RepID=UPI002405EBB0|nr:hypothetical protein [Parabacteroides sp. PF5-6]MDF9829865.1 hypothetical protein [Parabacteroides sp. PF5-6]